MSRAPWHRRVGGALEFVSGVVCLAAEAMGWLFIATVFWIAVAGGCASCAHSATLTIRGTAPAVDNAGTCAAPLGTPMTAGALVMVHVDVTGPAAFADSLTVTSGAPFTFARNVPAGTYTIRAWAKDAGGAGCDTLVSVTVKNPPGRVRL